MTRILHTSDLHGSYKALLACTADFDLWLDTGDFFDNVGRVTKTQGLIDPRYEAVSQIKWLGYKNLAARITAWLNGRPAVIMPGNHDFVSLATALKKAGANVHVVTPQGVTVMGIKFAGFREVPYIDNEWVGETQDFNALIDQTFASNPDILVTHAPAAGILDETEYVGYTGHGIKSLTPALTYAAPANLKHHFFGHCHKSGGQTIEEMGIQFHNGAGNLIVHEV